MDTLKKPATQNKKNNSKKDVQLKNLDKKSKSKIQKENST